MNSPGPNIRRDARSLKDAVTALVKECGGLERAASLTRVSPSSMQRYTSPADHDYQMPVDVALALEMSCGVPHVTRFLAMETKHVLVNTSPHDDTPLAVDVAKVGQEMAELFQKFGSAIADGKICKAEATALEESAVAGINALVSLMADTRRIRTGEA